MKILVLSESYPSPERVYAMGFVHSRSLEYLRLGYEVTVLSFAADGPYEFEGVEVCIRAAKPVYDLFGASNKLVAAYPDAEHDFPKSTREEAYKFLDQNLKK